MAGVLIRAAAGNRLLLRTVRYRPLGSPTAGPNWSYVHVPGVPGPVAYTVLVDVRAGPWVPGGCYTGYYTGYYPTPPSTRYSPPRPLIGIARAQPLV